MNHEDGNDDCECSDCMKTCECCGGPETHCKGSRYMSADDAADYGYREDR
jgi:hypothetical protein